jgi:preprotein translocase subunit SecB
VEAAHKVPRPEERMTDITNGGEMQSQPPQIAVLAQYIKDLSFENPHAPRSMAPTQEQPSISVQVKVEAAPLSQTDVEVALRFEGKAESAGTVLFMFDLVFAGVFRIQNVPQENIQPLVMIECPRLLFPFAREIIATSVRNGGFPPLLLDPVDFVGLYHQRMMQEQPAPGAAMPS